MTASPMKVHKHVTSGVEVREGPFARVVERIQVGRAGTHPSSERINRDRAEADNILSEVQFEYGEV